MPMKWDYSTDTHDCEIYEVYKHDGVDELLFACYTCGTNATFSHADYPKWRLAFAAAREAATQHVNLSRTP